MNLMSNLKKINKIDASHLVRKAIVYIRQSTVKQVRHNQESQRFAYRRYSVSINCALNL